MSERYRCKGCGHIGPVEDFLEVEHCWQCDTCDDWHSIFYCRRCDHPHFQYYDFNHD